MRPVALAAALGSALSLAACNPFSTAFNCASADQCMRSDGTQGTCIDDHCAFMDSTCSGGWRFGEGAGAQSNTCTTVEGDNPDGPIIVDRPPDIDAPCDIGGIDTCQLPTPQPFTITTNTTLDTDADGRCMTFPQAGGPDACLVFASSVSIAAGATLSANGSRPLIIVSQSGMTIDGVIDAGSDHDGKKGAGHDFMCATAKRVAEKDAGGGGGGAGGSFRGKGGDGGDGDKDNNVGADGTGAGGQAPDPVGPPPAFARGGCSGYDGGDGGDNGGKGGLGGGAVWLVANDLVQVKGGVRATGAGAQGGQAEAGGGGGGSGGYIKIFATAIDVTGTLSANGGGGGEGGFNAGMGVKIIGDRGGDGNLSANQANGGDGGLVNPGGNGGKGSATTNLNGSGGNDSNSAGGGGGGGAAGFIVLVGALTGGGTISPTSL